MNKQVFRQIAKYLVVWVLVLAWLLTIFSFSARTGEESEAASESVSTKIAEWLHEEPTKQDYKDALRFVRRAAYVTEYALLAVLALSGLSFSRSRRAILLTVLVVMAAAGANEFLQSFVPGRSGRLSDLRWDALGCAIGILAVLPFRPMLMRLGERLFPKAEPAAAGVPVSSAVHTSIAPAAGIFTVQNAPVRHRGIKRLMLWGCVGLWLMTIFFFSAQPADVSRETSGTFSDRLAEYLWEDPTDEQYDQASRIVRKTAHFCEYALLAVFILLAFRIEGIPFGVPMTLVFVFLAAGADEIHQLFVPGRAGMMTDVFIDFAGALSGIAAILVLEKLCSLLFSKRQAGAR